MTHIDNLEGKLGEKLMSQVGAGIAKRLQAFKTGEPYKEDEAPIEIKTTPAKSAVLKKDKPETFPDFKKTQQESQRHISQIVV